MCSKAQDFNKKILKDIIKLVEQLDSDFNNALKNLLTSEYSKIKESFKSEINDLILILESNIDPLEENYMENVQNYFNEIKKKCQKYNEVIIEIYENIYIKNIKKYNEELNALMNKIIPDFKPPNANSFSSDVHLNLNLNNFSTYTETSNAGQNGSSPFSVLEEENKNTQTQENISQNFENNYICTICHKEKAIKFCDECNQLVCETCEKKDKWTNNCKNDLEKISNISNSNKIGKVLYLNSLNNFIKKIILKSDYLLKKETLFEYPNMNITDDLTEEKYFKSINDILENNLEIKNLDIKDFNISEIDQRLVNLLKKIYKENKQSQFNSNSTYDLSRDVLEDEEEDDDDKSIDDETYIRV
jgi:hypothetical protein